MTRIQLQKLLDAFPPDLPVAVELDAKSGSEIILGKRQMTLNSNDLYLDLSHDKKEILIHNDQQYHEQSK